MSKPTTPGVAEAHRQLGDLERAGCRAHRRDDRVDGQIGVGRSEPEPVEHGLHHLVERQALLGAQLGSEPHLGVHDAVVGEILGALVGDPLDRITILHHTDGVGERLEVQHQVVALGATVEPGGEVVDVGGRQILVSELLREFDDGRRADTAVEVVVEQRLRRSLDQIGQ